MTSSNKVKGFAAGVIAAVCYGTNPLGTLELYGDGFNSSSVLIYRYLLAVVMFAVVMLFRKESFKVKWGHLIRLATLGCMFSLSSATLYVSFHYMAAGIASTILFVYPIMTAILMTVFFHEKVTWTTSLAILLAVSGVGLLYQGDGNEKLSTAGFALVMTSSLLYALYIISVNRWNTTMSNVKFTFWILVFGLLTVVIFTAISGESFQLLQTPKQWLCGLQLALLPTVLSLFFMTISINLIGSTPAAIMGALEPVTAVIIGVFVFGESFTFQLAIGIAAILAGVTLIIARKKG
ncbi:MAG: EamA family transporter [Prevotella sp.]|nr:EamA family transporter [Prevotella sp.]